MLGRPPPRAPRRRARPPRRRRRRRSSRARARSAARPSGRRRRSPSASAGAGGLRGAGRAGRGEHAARLERVQQRLGRQPGKRQRGDVRRARRAGHRRPRARDGAPAPAAPPADRAAPPRPRRPRRRAPGAPARPRARTRPAPAGSRCRRARPRSWPPPTQSGASRAPGRTQSAPAPRGPCSLCAGERERVGAQRARPQAQEAERLHGVDVQVRARAGGRARRAERARDLGDRLHGAELVLHQHHRDDRGVGADGRGDRLGGAPRRRGRARTTVERVALPPTSASAARITAGCSSALTTRWRPRAARAAPSTPSASASVPPLVKTISSALDVQRRGHLAARLLERARRRRAQPRAPRPGWRSARAPPRPSPPAPRRPAASRRRCPGKSRRSTIDPDRLAEAGSLR